MCGAYRFPAPTLHPHLQCNICLALIESQLVEAVRFESFEFN